MTRFKITLEQAVELVWKTFEDSIDGKIYVRKIPSMKVTEIANPIPPGSKVKVIWNTTGRKIT